MPISVDAELVNMSKDEFAVVSYDVMNEAFRLHRELGPLFEEKIYQKALIERVKSLQEEVRIDVSFQDFSELYYMDLVVRSGAVFELKTVEHLNSHHHGQLQNYLLLTGLQHGKLINFRSCKVEHKFVNAAVSHSERVHFSVSDLDWHATEGFGEVEKSFVKEMLRD